MKQVYESMLCSLQVAIKLCTMSACCLVWPLVVARRLSLELERPDRSAIRSALRQRRRTRTVLDNPAARVVQPRRPPTNRSGLRS